MFTVGLTGGIGSGKSAVAQLFRQHGITVVDADQAAREAVLPGSPALAKIRAHFGAAVLKEDGSLNRAWLRDAVFADPEQRQWLEALLHPAIAVLIDEALNSATSPYAILESPLLLETSQHALVDRVLVVDVSEATQVARAVRRDGSDEAQIRAIMDAQISRHGRLGRADDIIDNDGPLAALEPAVAALHQRYLALAGQRTGQ
ncbi:dephospho-CoA kinase [uncultured Porticoccus sp.]|uniref:dephospho-CoA kinase n=1 Tax=uncultured Porticoccus sp. TaxID=1256050 RepID=UPI00260964C5|nr:dephospho-CoA kinase [uncultured Porticoccus sp.]